MPFFAFPGGLLAADGFPIKKNLSQRPADRPPANRIAFVNPVSGEFCKSFTKRLLQNSRRKRRMAMREVKQN
jgi:hypothetical protein